MKYFQHWLFASISLIGLIVTSGLYTQAQQTSVGQVQLEIGQGQSCCVYGTSVVFGEKEVNFGITEFSWDFLSYHGTNTWWCKDLLGTETGWAMYISMSGDMENGNGWIIPAENVKISFDATNLVWGECEYTSNIAIDTSLSSAVPVVEKKEVTQNYGKICELGTSNVKLKVITTTGQAPGNYVGTLVINLPNFVTTTCDAELIGTFYDAETDWLSYVGNMWSAGITSNSGTFSYKPGEQITFKIGNVTLGNSVTPAPNGSVFVTDLFGLARTEITDPNVIKVGKLLQGIDTDNNPDNGIIIESSVASQFTENSNVTALDVSTKLTALSKPVRTAKQVVQHLEDTVVNKLEEDVNVSYSSVITLQLSWSQGNYDEIRWIAVDSWWNQYVVGNFQSENYLGGMVSFGWTQLRNNGQLPDLYVGKLDANGNRIRATKWWSDDSEGFSSIVVDDLWNTYVAWMFGWNNGGTGTFWSIIISGQQIEMGWYINQMFVGKIDSNGNWERAIWWKNIYTNRIDVDTEWNLYVAGIFYGTGIFGTTTLIGDMVDGCTDNGCLLSTAFIGKLDTNGNWIRAKKASSINPDSITIDKLWNVYMAGSFYGTGMFWSIILTGDESMGDSAISKLDENGNWLWAKKCWWDIWKNWSSTRNVTNDEGTTYIFWSFWWTGVFWSTTLVSDWTGIIGKMDKDGNWLIAKTTSLQWLHAIDNLWNVYIVGTIEWTLSIGDSQLVNRWTGQEYSSVVGYLAKLDSNLNPISAKMFEWLSVYWIVVDKFNSIHLGWYFNVPVTWGGEVFSGNWYAWWWSMIHKVSPRNIENTLLYQTTPPAIER